MYDDLLSAVQTLLTGSGLYGSVMCGLARPTGWPAASLWVHRVGPAGGQQDPRKAIDLVVQVQGYDGDDTEQGYLETLSLVAATERTLHRAKLPGTGSRALLVQEVEAMRMEQGGPTIYLMRVRCLTTPSTFTSP